MNLAVQSPGGFTLGAETPAKHHSQLEKYGLFCQERAEEEETKISHCSMSLRQPQKCEELNAVNESQPEPLPSVKYPHLPLFFLKTTHGCLVS